MSPATPSAEQLHNPVTGDELKIAVRQHWDAEPCGSRDIDQTDRRFFFREIERERYAREPYIPPFARFAEAKGQRVLEIGVGAGSDFINWVRAGAIATGIDLTARGVELTRERVGLESLHADVGVADAESLPFPNDAFDLVYSWGVLHHSPDTATAVREVARVLRPGGIARVTIYHLPSWVGFMLWCVHSLAKGRPMQSAREVIFRHLESPGTKAYTLAEACSLFAGFRQVTLWPKLSHGDLLLMRPGARYRSLWARAAWMLYPRWLVRALGDRFGTNLFIEAVK